MSILQIDKVLPVSPLQVLCWFVVMLLLTACGGGGGGGGLNSSTFQNQPPEITLSFPVTDVNQQVRFEGAEIDMTGIIFDPENDPIIELTVSAGFTDIDILPSTLEIVPNTDPVVFHWRAQNIPVGVNSNNFAPLRVSAKDDATLRFNNSQLGLGAAILQNKGEKIIGGAQAIKAGLNLNLSPTLDTPVNVVLGDNTSCALMQVESNNCAVVVDRMLNAVIAIDLSTGKRKLVSGSGVGIGPIFNHPSAIALDSGNSRVLVLGGASGELHSVDLATGDRVIISNNVIGGGPSLSVPSEMVLDEINDRVFVTDVIDRLFSIDLSNGIRAIVSGNEGVVNKIEGIGLDLVRDRVIVVDSDLDALLAIDLLNGNRTDLSSIGTGPLLEGPSGIVLDIANDRAFVIDETLDALFEIELTSGNRKIVSDLSIGTGKIFQLPSGLAMDLSNNKIIVIDFSLDTLISVDLGTGDREIILDVIGAGPLIDNGQSIALDREKNSVIVSDIGADALFFVDLATGNRSLISGNNIGVGPLFVVPTDIVLDKENDRVLVLDINKLLAVDLINGSREVLSGASVGMGPLLTATRGMVMLNNANAVLVLDVGLEALLFVDLVTGDRAILSDANIGTGPPLFSPRGVVFFEEKNTAMVLDASLKALIEIDLVTGDRRVLSDVNNGSGPLLDDLFLSLDLVLDLDNNDPAKDRVLFVQGFGSEAVLIAVELLSGNRSIISNLNVGEGPVFSFPKGMVIDGIGGRALVVEFSTALSSLYSVDLSSGDRVIFSGE